MAELQCHAHGPTLRCDCPSLTQEPRRLHTSACQRKIFLQRRSVYFNRKQLRSSSYPNRGGSGCGSFCNDSFSCRHPEEARPGSVVAGTAIADAAGRRPGDHGEAANVRCMMEQHRGLNVQRQRQQGCTMASANTGRMRLYGRP